MLDQRLKDISSLVDHGSTIIDIGCDHAYLSIYLVENKIVKKAYAVDNKIGPLSNANKNIKKSKLENYITTFLSDGFKDVKVYDFDTIIISGMGSETIIDILSYKEIKDCITLILEPQKNVHILREYLMNNQFEIVDEILSRDDEFFYSIIKAKKTKRVFNYSKEELYFGPIILKNRPKELILYKEKLLKPLKKALKDAKNKGELEEKIKFIEEA